MRDLRVLLVDDEEELVSALVDRLGYRGIQAKYALNGPQAIALARNEHFDVMVLDLKLPGMSGVEVHNIIRAERPELPVLLITGHGAPPEQIGEQQGDGPEFLEKPVSLEVLLEKIMEVTKDR